MNFTKEYTKKLALESMLLYKNDLFISHFQIEHNLSFEEFEKNKTDFYDYCIMYVTGEKITSDLSHAVNIEIQHIKREQELTLEDIEEEMQQEVHSHIDPAQLDIMRKMKAEYLSLGGGAGIEDGKEYYKKIMYD